MKLILTKDQNDNEPCGEVGGEATGTPHQTLLWLAEWCKIQGQNINSHLINYSSTFKVDILIYKYICSHSTFVFKFKVNTYIKYPFSFAFKKHIFVQQNILIQPPMIPFVQT
jgi:hypothetical protein